MKLKQKILRVFELIITLGFADWLRTSNTNLANEFLEKEEKINGIKYCCGDPSPGSSDERILFDLAERDYMNNPDEWNKYYKLKEQEENESDNQ